MNDKLNKFNLNVLVGYIYVSSINIKVHQKIHLKIYE